MPLSVGVAVEKGVIYFMSRIIVTLSGGKSSAWCAYWALKNFDREKVILYFNDTKWEHPDLYRFLNDLSDFLQHPIIEDSDGRSPEQLFYDHRALANNRMPFCSRVLKAERLQKYYRDGDILIFGIGKNEYKRAKRLVSIYQTISAKKNKWCKLMFPLITENVTNDDINKFFKSIKVKLPLLYDLGFRHNNCSGGCVRAGKKQWKLLYDKLPEVYKERERVEKEVREFLRKDIHFLKDETLESFRKKIEDGNLPKCYYKDDNNYELFECIGICDTQN